MKKCFIFLITLLIICVSTGGYALYKICAENSEIAEAESLSAEFDKYSPVIDQGNTYEKIFSDFIPKLTQMKSVNSDVIGWIYIPSTNINYPLLQGKDNEYYLTHSVNNKYSAAGSVFVDKRGLNENNNVIYAHNMGRSSNVMFHDITNFADNSYFNKISKGYIITAEGIIELSIFAYSLTKPQTEFYYDSVSVDFIKTNSINYREPSEGRLFTLSTCAYDYNDARGVLSCMGNVVYSGN